MNVATGTVTSVRTMLKIAVFFVLVSGCLSSAPLTDTTPVNFFMPTTAFNRFQLGHALYPADFMKLPLGFTGQLPVYYDDPQILSLNFPPNVQPFSNDETRPFGQSFPQSLPTTVSMNVPVNSFAMENAPFFPNFQGQQTTHQWSPQALNDFVYLQQLDNARRAARVPKDYVEEGNPVKQTKYHSRIMFMTPKPNSSSPNVQKQNLVLPQTKFLDQPNNNLGGDDRQPRAVGQQLPQGNNENTDQ